MQGLFNQPLAGKPFPGALMKPGASLRGQQLQQTVDAHAGSKHQHNQRAVANIIKHSQQAVDIIGFHGSWQRLGGLKPDGLGEQFRIEDICPDYLVIGEIRMLN